MINGMKTSISRIYYGEPKDVTLEEMGEFYFYYNHQGLTDEMIEDYERYEESQIKKRNQIISDAIVNGDIPNNRRIKSTLFGVSSIKNKPILVIEY